MRKFGVFLLSCMLLAVPITSLAASYTINNPIVAYAPDPYVAPSEYKAIIELSTIDMEPDELIVDLDPNSFIVRIWNLTAPAIKPDDFPSNIILTGWGTVVPEGYYIEGGTWVNDGDRNFTSVKKGNSTFTSPVEMLNHTWGYDNTNPFDTPTEGTQFEGVFNAGVATLEANVDDIFADGNGTGAVKGPQHGVYYNSGNPWSTDYPVVYDWIEFQIDLGYEGTENMEDIDTILSNIARGPNLVAFGSPLTIPEPETMLLLGIGLIGIAGLGRRKFIKKNRTSR